MAIRINRFYKISLASIKSNKAKIIFFSIFIIVSFILLVAIISLVRPLWYNVEYKINNHILNREFTVYLNKSENSDEQIEKIKKQEHVQSVFYQIPAVQVNETSGILFDDYELDRLHEGFVPPITDGRAFDKNEKNVALVADRIKDYDETQHKTNRLNGSELIGKELTFADFSGNTYKARVIGTYSTTDPFFHENQIIIPNQDLLNFYGADMPEASDTGKYTVVVDNYKNLDNVMQEVGKDFGTDKEENMSFDVSPYNTAIIMLSVMLVVFLIMDLIGVCVFISGYLKNRSKEFALYRALGYKTKHIFTIFFMEYTFISVLAMLAGTLLWLVISITAVNPYLEKLLGGTIMNFSLNINPADILITAVIFILIILAACLTTAKKSKKISPALLLKEN